MAKRKKIHQRLDKRVILVSRIDWLLVLVFSWHLELDHSKNLNLPTRESSPVKTGSKKYVKIRQSIVWKWFQLSFLQDCYNSNWHIMSFMFSFTHMLVITCSSFESLIKSSSDTHSFRWRPWWCESVKQVCRSNCACWTLFILK